MPAIRESRIEAALVRAVSENGGISYKLDPSGRRNKPDRLVILPYGVFFVELKKTGEKPRPAQVRELNRLRQLGCRVCTIDTVDAAQWLAVSYGRSPNA